MISTERARWGPLAAALLAYHEGQLDAKLLVRTDLRTLEEWPVSLFFRESDDFPPLEREALERCGPRVIDVGAGAGPHTLALLERGHDVLAVESLPDAAETSFATQLYHLLRAMPPDDRYPTPLSSITSVI